uniref:Uncharacterized protein n=1 Tax=Noctiluca scintillans TaxID=2966 RepID=A0A7S0ZYT1_NOCSC
MAQAPVERHFPRPPCRRHGTCANTMRNIALLEWGPASLYHIQPRERIRVRTGWLEGGPLMPPFLSTSEESRAKIKVRYALSAYEDLNRAIRNLRRCFGFPYQEYVGYLNTMTRTHRARREHSILVDSLRRWAMFGNVDAVLWIDYAKANQPPGSFKMGSRDSRPFSPLHILICAASDGEADEYEESEAWSDSDADPGTQHTPNVTASQHEFFSATRSPLEKDCRPAGAHLERPRLTVLALGRHSRHGHTGATLKPSAERDRATVKSLTSESGSPTLKLEAMRKRQEPRDLLQDEVIPAHGSIYKRSITPGPGYYCLEKTIKDVGPSFTIRRRCFVDDAVKNSKISPGPGDYESDASLSEAKKPYGCLARGPRMVEPLDIHKRFPFSKAASERESD